VPPDIQTNINAIMRELNDLTQYVRQEQTRTLSGRRVLEADEDMVPMAPVDEYGEISEMDNPKFVPVEYTLRKRAGFLPLTSELLQDTDQNILAYVQDWIARKVVVTRNVLIRNVLATLDKVPVSGINDLKRILNVDLDPAISTSAIILTNQDGFHFLDTQEDNDGRPLLQPDPTNATQRLFKGRPIVVLSNRHFPTVDNKAPMVVGNLRQLVSTSGVACSSWPALARVARRGGVTRRSCGSSPVTTWSCGTRARPSTVKSRCRRDAGGGRRGPYSVHPPAPVAGSPSRRLPPVR